VTVQLPYKAEAIQLVKKKITTRWVVKLVIREKFQASTDL